MHASYGRFAVMVGASTLVMFALIYLNTNLWSYVFFSETRSCMAPYTGAAMVVAMLSFKLKMCTSSRANLAIYTIPIVVFAASLCL